MPKNNQRQKNKKEVETKLPHRMDGLKDQPLAFVECRAYRIHAWKLVGFYRWKQGSSSGICRSSTCMRCGTSREDFYDTRGELYYRAYDYPDGYMLPGTGVVSTFDAIRELMRRTKIAANADALSAEDGSTPLRLVKSS